MSIRDEMRFKEFHEKWLKESKYDQHETDALKEAYEAGFYRGIEAAKDYDPKWDAD